MIGPGTKHITRAKSFAGPCSIVAQTNCIAFIASDGPLAWVFDRGAAHIFPSPADADAWIEKHWPRWREAMAGCHLFLAPPLPESAAPAAAP